MPSEVNSTQIEQELRTTENLLSKIATSTNITLNQLSRKIKSKFKLSTGRQARKEVKRVLAKIDSAVRQPVKELLQIKQELSKLEKIKLQTGKIVSKSASWPHSSLIKPEFLRQEKTTIEKKLMNKPRLEKINPTPELLAIEQQLAQLNSE